MPSFPAALTPLAVTVAAALSAVVLTGCGDGTAKAGASGTPSATGGGSSPSPSTSAPATSAPAASADASAATSQQPDSTAAAPTASDGLLSGRQIPLPSLKRTRTGTGAAVRAIVAGETFCWLPTTWQPSRLGPRLAGATFANSGAPTTRSAKELVLVADPSTRTAIAERLTRACAHEARESADSPDISVKVGTLAPAPGYAGFTVENFEDADAYAAAVVWSKQTDVLVIVYVWLGNDDRTVRGLPPGSALADAALAALHQAGGR